MNNVNNCMRQYLFFALIAIGLSGNALASNGCLSNSATFTSSVGSTTSCANNDMAGCTVGSGETGCTYLGVTCDFEIVVSPAVGDSTDDTTSFTVVNPGLGKPTCQLKASITQGNQGANYCVGWYTGGVGGDVLSTLDNKGTGTVSHKSLQGCTNESFAGEPVINLEKTVVRVFESTTGPTYDCSAGADLLDVIAPVDVVFCYTLSNTGQSSIEDLVLIDDNGTPDDGDSTNGDETLDDLVFNPGSLAGGATDVVDSGPVTITEFGDRINIASVSGTYNGSQCSTCADSDSATVNVAVECDDTTQTAADDTGAVVERTGLDGTTRCGPASDNPTTETRSVAILCDGSCDLKPACVDEPSLCKQPCKPSRNWTYEDELGNCIFAKPGPGKAPLCQEVLGNVANAHDASCSAIHNPSFIRSNGRSYTVKGSPTVYYFPGTSAGGTTTDHTIYCFLNPGDSPSDCPADSDYIF